MCTVPAGGAGTGHTPDRAGCRFRRAGSVQRRTDPRSAWTGAACCGGRTPGSPGPARRPAPPSGPPVREGSRRAEAGHAAGAGQLTDIGGDPLQDRRHPGQAGHHQRPAGVIAVGAQVDRLGILADVQRVSQPAHCPSQLTSSSRRSQTRSRPSSPASSSLPGSSGAAQAAARSSPRTASSSSGSEAAVIWRTRAGESPAAAASVRIEIPSARAEASVQARSRPACSRRHAACDTAAVPAARRPSGP
jgi:hypothetical protein